MSAHLLAPIQRLCRYPLHLSELVKFTPTKQDILKQQPSLIDVTKSEAEMIDCKETLESALGAMKRVTEMVNEGMTLTFLILYLSMFACGYEYDAWAVFILETLRHHSK